MLQELVHQPLLLGVRNVSQNQCAIFNLILHLLTKFVQWLGISCDRVS
jgi:hypothetical protein